MISLEEAEKAFFNTTDFEPKGKKLGEGGFGEVYLCKNKKENKNYAIKFIKVSDDFNGQDQMLLMRESLIHQQLKHPAIVGFKGVNFQSFKNPKKLKPSIITEYYKNGSLRKILNDEFHALADFNWTSTKKHITLLGISNAMKYLHGQGFIHRDLKPENVLLSDEYYPLICDFGCSRCMPKVSERILTEQIGTPMYMAPEILSGETNYMQSVDVYAFSMLAYEIVVGKVPFSELGNIASIALGMKIVSGYRPPIPETVPVKMRELIERCWNQEAAKRPSFDEIYEELSTDFSIFGEKIDDDEIRDYIELIEDNESTSISFGVSQRDCETQRRTQQS